MALDKSIVKAAQEAIIERYSKRRDAGQGYFPPGYETPEYWDNIVKEAKMNTNEKWNESSHTETDWNEFLSTRTQADDKELEPLPSIVDNEVFDKRIEMMKQIVKVRPKVPEWVNRYNEHKAKQKVTYVVREYESGYLMGVYSSENLAYDAAEALFSLYQIDCDVEEMDMDMTVDELLERTGK